MNIDSDQCLQLSAADGLIKNFPKNHTVATLVLAHGAGAPMDSPFMDAIVKRLVNRGVAVIRFEFPYMASRREGAARRPPNPQAVLLERWKQVFEYVRNACDGTLAIGGKSMGGRMASLIADELGADALICLGYPFYAVGKPEKPRIEHLESLQTPTLIIQGERDALGNKPAVEAYMFSSAIHLHWLAAADHDLKPLKSSGKSQEQYLDAAADAIAEFLETTAA